MISVLRKFDVFGIPKVNTTYETYSYVHKILPFLEHNISRLALNEELQIKYCTGHISTFK